MDRDEPRKVICKPLDEDSDCLLQYCPNCNELLSDLIPESMQKYCKNCGQRLDWAWED